LGESEAALQKRNARFCVYRLPFHKIDWAITGQNASGLIKVFVGRRGRILEVTILGTNAGDIISEWRWRRGMALRCAMSPRRSILIRPITWATAKQQTSGTLASSSRRGCWYWGNYGGIVAMRKGYALLLYGNNSRICE
jgi:Pyridine nucleotide-disulphide oxidoreductase, dimerisation domain